MKRLFLALSSLLLLFSCTNDAEDFDWLIGEWKDIIEHAKIRKILANDIKPSFVSLIKDKGFVPSYAKVVSATPQSILDAAAMKKGNQ